MFQDFQVSGGPENGKVRLAALRKAMKAAGVDGFLVPRADAHQGEYVAERDARLGWLTGFTGSAGQCVVLPDVAGVFVDGRYRLQVREQIADVFTPLDWPAIRPGQWLAKHLPARAVVGFDPWLHTAQDLDELQDAAPDIVFQACSNLVDRIWQDQPDAPAAKASVYPETLAGKSHSEKRAEMADILRESGQSAVVLSLPESICWLLNIRGADIPRIPVVQCFALLYADARVRVFGDLAKFTEVAHNLGPEITFHPFGEFNTALCDLTGPVRVDRGTAPVAVSHMLENAVDWGPDPCILAKAAKSEAEIAGSRAAHLRDGAAMCAFLCWLDARADEVVHNGARVSETEIVRALEGFRRATNQLQDISFDTIAGFGPHGAIVHYRVSEASDIALRAGGLLLVDSGGQYVDGTTDITRTIPIGPPTQEHRTCFTRVLQGMIAISRARWPRGLAGRDLDVLARFPLWTAGQDYDHGTGHGVGAYLSVHEGPQRLSRTGEVPLAPGMILSNEPGYYREGSFGIRIENLVVVQEAGHLNGGDTRDQLSFETLTWAPIDRRLIDVTMLSPSELRWINTYHAEVAARITPLVAEDTALWLKQATAPLVAKNDKTH